MPRRRPCACCMAAGASGVGAGVLCSAVVEALGIVSLLACCGGPVWHPPQATEQRNPTPAPSAPHLPPPPHTCPRRELLPLEVQSAGQAGRQAVYNSDTVSALNSVSILLHC